MTSGSSDVQISVGHKRLAGDLVVPPSARGLIIFAHGSGSGRLSPRNQAVARALQARGFATLLADLLTAREDAVDRVTAHLRFDIGLLSRRLVGLVEWSRRQPQLASLGFGLFGASTGAAAALIVAAAHPQDIAAVVSRGGRADLAGYALGQVSAPTLLIVGGRDPEVIQFNEWAKARMRCLVSLEIVPDASHLFEEPGTLDQVATLAGTWFMTHLSCGSLDGRTQLPAARSLDPDRHDLLSELLLR